MALGLKALLTLCAIAIVYGFVANRMMKAAQPLRLAGYDAAMAMLDARCLPHDEHEGLRFMVRNLFNGFLPWILVVAFPFVGLYEAYHLTVKRRPSAWPQIQDAALRAKFEETTNRLAVAIFSQSPIAAVLFLGELLVAIVCLASLWPMAIIFRDVGRFHAALQGLATQGRHLRGG